MMSPSFRLRVVIACVTVLQFGRVFAQKGVAVESRNDNGNTPLHLAAIRGDVNAVRALLKAGADANALNLEEATPLLYGTGNAEIVRELLAHHAKPNAVSKKGITPLISAAWRG